MGFFDVGVGLDIKLFAKSLYSKVQGGLVRAVNGVFKSKLTQDREMFNANVKAGDYDIKKEFENAKKDLATSTDVSKFVAAKRKQVIYKNVLLQGHLYYFGYYNPLGKDTLDHWDTTPLVLSFGVYFAQTGNLVEYGVNLHYLPPKVREAFVTDIFNLFAEKYKGEMYSEKPRKINEFSYEVLRQYIDKYGIDFAVHAYIPKLRSNCIMFEYHEWPNACRIETAGFRGRTIEEIYKMYSKHMKDKREEL